MADILITDFTFSHPLLTFPALLGFLNGLRLPFFPFFLMQMLHLKKEKKRPS